MSCRERRFSLHCTRHLLYAAIPDHNGKLTSHLPLGQEQRASQWAERAWKSQEGLQSTKFTLVTTTASKPDPETTSTATASESSSIVSLWTLAICSQTTTHKRRRRSLLNVQCCCCTHDEGIFSICHSSAAQTVVRVRVVSVNQQIIPMEIPISTTQPTDCNGQAHCPAYPS